MSNNTDKKNKELENRIKNAALAGASNEVVQRHGSAIKEHLIAYSGIDSENVNPATGSPTVLKKSLKSIQAQKTNEEHAFSISRQKAGWAAEVKDTAETNSERILEGDKTRKIRHDDLPNTPANHQLYDHVEIDSTGKVIMGSGSQMKFIGASAKDPNGINNAKNALKELYKNNKFQKYIDNNVIIEVPKDEYAQMIDAASAEIDLLKRQLERVQAEGKSDAAERIEKQINNLKTLKKNLKPSKLTRKQSLEAVESPKLSTAKSVGKIAHAAGVEQAKIGGAISGAISLIKNTVAYARGEKTAEEAALDVVTDGGAGAAISYATAFSGSIIKGAMQNSSSSFTRALSKTNLPTRLVTTTTNVGKTMSSYIKGEIDGAECIEKLGQDGFAEIGSAMLGTMGASLGRGSSKMMMLVGGLAGSALGYAAAVAVYQEVSSAMKDAKIAREERIRIENECIEVERMLIEYRQEMNNSVNKYFVEHIEAFNEGFMAMDSAIQNNDINGFISGNNKMQKLLGHPIQFETKEDFDAMILSEDPFVI